MWGKRIAFGGGHLAGAVDKVSPLLCHAEFLSLRPDVVPPFIRSAKNHRFRKGESGAELAAVTCAKSARACSSFFS